MSGATLLPGSEVSADEAKPLISNHLPLLKMSPPPPPNAHGDVRKVSASVPTLETFRKPFNRKSNAVSGEGHQSEPFEVAQRSVRSLFSTAAPCVGQKKKTTFDKKPNTQSCAEMGIHSNRNRTDLHPVMIPLLNPNTVSEKNEL